MKDWLNNLELDNKRIALIVFVVLIVAYLDFALVIKAQTSTLKGLSPKIAKLQSDLDKFNRESLRVRDLKKKGGPAPSAGKKFIQEGQITSLLEDISDIANRDSVQIVLIKPAKEQPGKGVVSPAGFNSFLITLELSCQYHQLGRFLNDIENAQFFMAVKDLRVSSMPPDYVKQKANLTIRTYTRK